MSFSRQNSLKNCWPPSRRFSIILSFSSIGSRLTCMNSVELTVIDDFIEVKKFSRPVRFSKCSSLSVLAQGSWLYPESVFPWIPYEFSAEKLPSATPPQKDAVLVRIVFSSSKQEGKTLLRSLGVSFGFFLLLRLSALISVLLILIPPWWLMLSICVVSACHPWFISSLTSSQSSPWCRV